MDQRIPDGADVRGICRNDYCRATNPENDWGGNVCLPYLYFHKGFQRECAVPAAISGRAVFENSVFERIVGKYFQDTNKKEDGIRDGKKHIFYGQKGNERCGICQKGRLSSRIYHACID